MSTVFSKEIEIERMERERQEEIYRRRRKSGAVCAGGNCTPATLTLRWRAG